MHTYNVPHLQEIPIMSSLIQPFEKEVETLHFFISTYRFLFISEIKN